MTEKTPAFECRAAKGRSCSAGRHPACFRGHSVKPSGPYPLGKNQSLSSPPLEPRGLLLSVMRQKVGKERSQGVFAPLANPHRFLACPLRKFGPSPTPLRLCKTPVGVPSGTAEAGDAKHRERLGKILSPKLGRDLPFANRRHPTNRTAARKPRSQIARPSAAPRGGRNFVAAPPATGPSPKKNLAPRSLAARLGKYFRFNSSLKQCISLLRRARGAARHSNRAVSILTKAARRDANASAARAALTPGRRAHRAFYWPGGRENILCPRAWGNRIR